MGIGNSHIPLVGEYIGETTLEGNLAISSNVEYLHSILALVNSRHTI